MRSHLSTRVLDDLFGRLHAMLGDKFFAAYASANPQVFRDEWAAALADFKPIEIERGLVQVSRQKFVPTLGEFSQWCRPALDPEYAFHEAYAALRQRDQGLLGDWSHPAVWRAASAMSLEVRQGDFAKVRGRWRVELERELSKGWSDIPQPPMRLSDQTKTRPPNEAERQKINKLLGKGDDAGAA